MRKKVAIITGGYSGEAEISYASAQTILKHIPKDAFEPYLIDINSHGWFCVLNDHKIKIDKNDFSIIINEKKIQFDVVYNMLHGTPSEDGKILGYFDILGIPVTGCDYAVAALTFNKAYCNHVIRSLGIMVPDSIHLIKGQSYSVSAIEEKIGFPCFIKPANGGSSVGMSKVKQVKELKTAIEKAFHEDDQIILERFIPGRELTCGVYKSDNGLIALPVTEIISANEFFDYEAKYTPGKANEVTPADIAETLSNKVKSTAAFLYEKLNCKGIVRADFIFDGDQLYFIEVNTVPGFSSNSIVPQQLAAIEIELDDFVRQQIEICLKNYTGLLGMR